MKKKKVWFWYTEYNLKTVGWFPVVVSNKIYEYLDVGIYRVSQTTLPMCVTCKECKNRHFIPL